MRREKKLNNLGKTSKRGSDLQQRTLLNYVLFLRLPLRHERERLCDDLPGPGDPGQVDGEEAQGREQSLPVAGHQTITGGVRQDPVNQIDKQIDTQLDRQIYRYRDSTYSTDHHEGRQTGSSQLDR